MLAPTDGRRRFPVVVVGNRVLTNPTFGELQRVLDDHRIRPSPTGVDARPRSTPRHPRRGAGDKPQFTGTCAPGAHTCVSGRDVVCSTPCRYLAIRVLTTSNFSRSNERLAWRSACTSSGQV